MNTSDITIRVARKSQEAVDICTFELVEANGAPPPAFSAGSHRTRYPYVQTITDKVV